MLRKYNNDSDAFYNKPRLLILIASTVLSISLIPFILPHVFHPHMIYHILLHVISLIISQFLAVVSLLAYLKSRTIRIFYMTLGFITLVVAEYIYLLNTTQDIQVKFIPYVNIEISHVVLLVMVIFFGISFLKNPR
ncbi:MAG TPA: hypothetical protein VFV86_00445 [Nitrososphaeraceae archaeon]|nr:hypothetical protein [Nitrososphaeraceae archaeon]